MALVQFKSGLKANLPASQATGVIYFTTDTGEIWLEGRKYAGGVELAEVQRALAGYLDGSATVAGALQAAIQALDATVTQTAGTDGLALSITQTDGVLTNVTGSIAAETYDDFGAAATAKSEVIGVSTDEKTANTIYGAKAFATDAVSTLDGSLADVAKSGAAEDVSYNNTDSGLTATDVQAAIDEVAAASAGGVDSKTVYITETAGTSSDLYSKRYGVYQGANGSASSPVAGEKLADIDIPKDMVVESGSVIDITYNDGKLYDGSTDVTELIKGAGGTATAADAGKYIKLVIANSSSSALYIAAKDLVDIYTPEADATQIQLAIVNNVISATVVAGSIGTTELADDSVTAAKVAIAAHSEANAASAGADGLLVSVTTTDGQVSAVSASIAANTYDAYGAAADVLGTSGDQASANTVYGAKAYADSVVGEALAWGSFDPAP